MQVTSNMGEEYNNSPDPIQHLQAQMDQLFTMIGKGHDSPEEHIAGMVSSFSYFANTNRNAWIIDIGATHHMTGSRNLFHSLNTLNSPILVNLQIVVIFLSHTLDTYISLPLLFNIRSCIYHPLHAICYLLANSYLSLHCLFADSCALQDLRQKQTTAIGDLSKGLYLLHFPSFAAANVTQTTSHTLWQLTSKTWTRTYSYYQ